MPMPSNGLAKLTEELGELQQVIGKMLNYGTGPHPDGTESLIERFEDEAADVIAAIKFTIETHNANETRIHNRSSLKLALFHKWHKEQ
jgi:NTP pyrophosphatase (non-canonical NTP hydrolase)